MILAVLCLIAQTPIYSTILGPDTEDRIVFTHGGFTYSVGKTSGKVLVLNGSKPIDEDKKPVAEKIRYLSLVVQPDNAEQARWRVSQGVRSLIGNSGISFFSYLSSEQDIDTLKLRTWIETHGLPLLIYQDDKGKVVRAERVASEAALVDLVSKAVRE